MARIAGIDLQKQRGVIGLTYIYGIGKSIFRNFEKRWYQRRQEKSTNGMTMNWLPSELLSLKTLK